MGNRVSSPYSYHVSRVYGDFDLHYWPASAFGQYCSDEKKAREAYRKIIKEDPTGGYKLVRYDLVCNRAKEPLGITGVPVILETHDPNTQKLKEQVQSMPYDASNHG